MGRHEFATSVPTREREWYFVAATYDANDGRVTLVQLPRDTRLAHILATEVTRTAQPAFRANACAPITIAAEMIGCGPDQRTTHHFNGKIDSPRLFCRPLAGELLQALRVDRDPKIEGLLGTWAFEHEMSSARVVDISGNGNHGVVVNMPMRGVTGHNWQGNERDYRLAPGEYGGIYFHEDDLEDARWELGSTFAIPHNLRTGVYAAHLTSARGEDFVPFFVAAQRDKPGAHAALLAPTLTYLAYANIHSPWTASDFFTGLDIDIEQRLTPQDRYMIDHQLLGVYDCHIDGSGNCFSSWRRPIMNMRPGYRSPWAQCAVWFSADLHLVDWLEQQGHRYDLITDHCLHREGADLLRNYRVILTGSHPEYWTREMLDGLEEYLEHGGRLMYLGGNGFYWVTSIDPARPHMIEVRRGATGTRSWEGGSGEDRHATTGEPGGLWRHRGRPAQRLVGVGSTAAGSGPSRPYRLLASSRDPRAAFIFEGVPSTEPVGASGLVLGGAGGYETDRFDSALGTPPHALLLATATEFGAEWFGLVEDALELHSGLDGRRNPLVRADMVYFEGPDGGAVFSTGSIAWCGALSQTNYENSVSRITDNVLRRFLSAEPIA
jgi:N,N-dimethylformamidase